MYFCCQFIFVDHSPIAEVPGQTLPFPAGRLHIWYCIVSLSFFSTQHCLLMLVSTIFPASECRAAFHTMPSAFNEAELALPRGGFRVAGTAYLRQIGQDKVYLFRELSSQCCIHTQTQLAKNGGWLCVLTLFPFQPTLHTWNLLFLWLNSYHTISLPQVNSHTLHLPLSIYHNLVHITLSLPPFSLSFFSLKHAPSASQSLCQFH